MNTTKTLTSHKVMLTIRLEPELYRAVTDYVRDKKDFQDHRYSMNQLITEILEENLKGYKRKGSEFKG